ncbi:MAG: hypothetical protein U0T83_05090 [Bacteriovoracaceae bacterium]
MKLSLMLNIFLEMLTVAIDDEESVLIRLLMKLAFYSYSPNKEFTEKTQCL